jgi:hypothetical protein
MNKNPEPPPVAMVAGASSSAALNRITTQDGTEIQANQRANVAASR